MELDKKDAVQKLAQTTRLHMVKMMNKEGLLTEDGNLNIFGASTIADLQNLPHEVFDAWGNRLKQEEIDDFMREVNF